VKIGTRAITVVFLVFSMGIVTLQMFRASGWNVSEVGLFEGWVIVPYIIFFCISLLVKKTQTMNLSLCMSSLLMFLFTLLFYSDISSSSTACLVFLFGPFYLLIGIPVFIGLSFIIAKILISKQSSLNNLKG
jgi:hypothetical protein